MVCSCSRYRHLRCAAAAPSDRAPMGTAGGRRRPLGAVADERTRACAGGGRRAHGAAHRMGQDERTRRCAPAPSAERPDRTGRRVSGMHHARRHAALRRRRDDRCADGTRARVASRCLCASLLCASSLGASLAMRDALVQHVARIAPFDVATASSRSERSHRAQRFERFVAALGATDATALLRHALGAALRDDGARRGGGGPEGRRAQGAGGAADPAVRG